MIPDYLQSTRVCSALVIRCLSHLLNYCFHVPLMGLTWQFEPSFRSWSAFEGVQVGGRPSWNVRLRNVISKHWPGPDALPAPSAVGMEARVSGASTFSGSGSALQICFFHRLMPLCSGVLSLLSLQLQCSAVFHLPFQAEDKKMALPTGLSATEKADAHEEDELQAVEEVCGQCRPPEVFL